MEPYVYILIALGALVAAFLAVVLIRTLRFTPRPPYKAEEDTPEFDRDGAIEALRELVKCRTVSYYSREQEDDGEFEKLVKLFPRLYPAFSRTCTLTRFPGRALLFKWEGESHASPAVMMSHYDVVPVSESDWTHPPFDAEIEGDVIYGRGTLDTKVTLNAAVYAANTLIERGFVPKNDIYFAFSGSEEINGEGAPSIVKYFEENNINPSIVLDEGGAVTSRVFPGVKDDCAFIGIAEKGHIDLEYKVKSAGGHASAPIPNSPIALLSEVCCRIEKRPFPIHKTRPALEMFDTLGRHSSFLYRMIFSNLWCFGWVIRLICDKRGGDLNAMLRTTVAFTQASGSSTSNVIPPEATMVTNIRLNPADTVEGAMEYIRGIIDNDRVELTALRGTNPSRISVSKCEAFDNVATAVVSTWRGVIVSPYLMMQCSDSRHWGKISDKVYRFSAMDLTSEERKTIHGNDEHIRIDCALRAVEFYIRLLKKY